jgi:NAD(P)-dependent dehydrogenase (short-subunit alcohol dehydrogenase family)
LYVIDSSTHTGRLGLESDIAGTALFLSSAAGAFVTGTVLPLDGGLSLQSAASMDKIKSKI